MPKSFANPPSSLRWLASLEIISNFAKFKQTTKKRIWILFRFTNYIPNFISHFTNVGVKLAKLEKIKLSHLPFCIIETAMKRLFYHRHEKLLSWQQLQNYRCFSNFADFISNFPNFDITFTTMGLVSNSTIFI